MTDDLPWGRRPKLRPQDIARLDAGWAAILGRRHGRRFIVEKDGHARGDLANATPEATHDHPGAEAA